MLRVFAILVMMVAVLELVRQPNGLFAFSVGMSVPPMALFAITGPMRLPVFEFAVMESLSMTVFQISCFGWFLVRVDQELRAQSDGAIIGKWTTVSGVSGFGLYLLNFFYSAYFNTNSMYIHTMSISFVSQSPYTELLVTLREVAIPLLLIGATWHPSRMVYFGLDHYTGLENSRIFKWLPYALLLPISYGIFIMPILEGYHLSWSMTADAIVLFLPAVVSISASVREYHLYELVYREPVLRNGITDRLYSLTSKTYIAGTSAGLALGLWLTMFNYRLGFYGSMGVFEFLGRFLAILILFRILAAVLPADWDSELEAWIRT